MAGAANVRLRCSSWPQLVSIYQRDLSRGRLFLKTAKPPKIGTAVSLRLLLPSGAAIDFTGSVIEQKLDGKRGSGAVVALDELDQAPRIMLELAVRAAIEHANRREKTEPAPTPPESPPLSADAGEPMLGAEGELIDALRIELETFGRLNPFQILGIGYAADTRAVHTAFAELSKRFHPDRYVRYQSPEVSALAESLFVAARQAFRELSTPDNRAAALEAIRAEQRANEPTTPPVAEDLLDPLAAFPEAVELFEAERYDDAVEFFYRAARGEVNREAARIGIQLASAMRALASGDRLDAAERLAEVLEKHPNNEIAARELASLRRDVSKQRQQHLAHLMTVVGEDA